ncbi:MAG: serine/threonine protein phosphatase, partial [Spirochaetales bacterium]
MRYWAPLLQITLLVSFAIASSGNVYGQSVLFDEPRVLQEDRSRFPFAGSVDGRLVLIFQEPAESDENELHLRVYTSEEGREWVDQGAFGGPVDFGGTEPNIFSATVTSDDRIIVAVGESETRTVIYESSDRGESFSEISEVDTAETSVAPVVSARDDGGIVLFINQDDGARQRLFAARSERGRDWTDFELIESEDDLTLAFAPHYASDGERDLVVFQGLETGGEATGYQLYAAESLDGGETWEPARRLTDFSNPGTGDNPEEYDNQRPYLVSTDEGLYVTWERRYQRQSARAFSGRIDSSMEVRDVRQVSPGLRSARSPKIIEFNNELLYLWFEERSGSREIVLAEPERLEFSTRVISDIAGDSTIPLPVEHRDRLHVFWHNERDGNRAVAYLEPDQSVDPPELVGNNFTAGSRAPRETAEIRLEPPEDPSGIEGYSYVWTRDPEETVPRETRVEGEQRTLRLDTDEDGEWFLRARAQDGAGNWSDTRTITFLRDLTPPDPVAIEEPETDDDGFLESNTFEISWEPQDAEYIEGYTYSLTRVGDETAASVPQDSLSSPPDRIVTTDTSISRSNADNGTWVLQVAPIDDIGNIGEVETLVFRLNKYVPVTYINSISSDVDILGRTTLDIRGRGFAEGGEVERVILDSDAEEPYDYEFTVDDDEYEVENDRLITGPTLDAIRTGEYRVGLVHPDRGLYFTDEPVALDAQGTVKFGDFSVDFAPSYPPATEGHSLPVPMLVVWFTAALLAALGVFSGTRIVAITREISSIQQDVLAIVHGRPLPDRERSRRISRMKKKGVGLRLKFAAFFVALVVSVVSLVALPLGNFIIESQQQSLTDGLRERTTILLNSLVGGSVQLLPDAEDNLFELNTLTLQTDQISEALHATITEFTPGQDGDEIVWASNDPRVTRAGELEDEQRITDTDSLLRGETRYNDKVSEDIPELAEEIEELARERLGDIPDQIDELNRERINLATEGGSDAEERVGEIDDTITELETEQTEILNEIGDIIVSSPELRSDAVLNADTTNYLFYKPIVYREIDSDVYFHGVVRVMISSERIIREINNAQRNLVTTTAIITVIAVLVGIVGALVLSSIIVIPITRLVRGVEVIRDTEDKTRLADHSISLRSRDELRTLAESINEMTQGLVRAAVANKDLVVGKEVQKMFIPLRTDSRGRKFTTAREDNESIELFGYYEGAKGVSGDYFNYLRLDDRHWVFMKCDIAGKGVPAALIMVEVATIYLSYFRSWNRGKIDRLPEV